MAESSISRTNPVVYQRITTTSTTVDISDYVGPGNGVYGILIIARAWITNNAASTLAYVSGIQAGSTYYGIKTMAGNAGPVITQSTPKKITINFGASSGGGFYAIMPVCICPDR